MSKKLIRKILKSDWKDSTDEYLNWLLVTNAGMQHKGNIFCFEEAIRNLSSDEPLIELGAYAGLSANIMTYLLQKHGKKNIVISVDPWIMRGHRDGEANVPSAYLKSVGENRHISREAFIDFVKKAYIRNVHFFSTDNLPFAFQLTSDDFFERWSKKETLTDIMNHPFTLGGPIAFAFIDGNHDEDFAQRDFENVDRWLVPGGFILFDNSEDGSPFGSAKVAKRIEKDARYQLIAKNPNRLFRKK